MASKTAPELKPFVIDDAIAEGGEDRPDPFMVQLNKEGDKFALADPEQLDWQDAYAASASESPFTVLALIIPEDVRDEFFETSITVAAMKRLIKEWRDHYEIDENTYAQGGGLENRAARRALDRQRRKSKK